MTKSLWKLAALTLAVASFGVLATSAVASPAVQADKDIVEIAIEDGRFTTLVTALQEAELVDTLKSDGPFTVFAPTDDAFAALPDGVLETLLADKAALTDVLLYHVVAGKVMAEDVIGLETANTVLGETLTVTVDDGNVMLNNANVIITDIEGSNGVIHVIDAVLVPSTVAVMVDDNASMESTEMAEADKSAEAAKTEMEEEAGMAEAPGALPTTGAAHMSTSQLAVLAMIVVVGLALLTGGVTRLRGEKR